MRLLRSEIWRTSRSTALLVSVILAGALPVAWSAGLAGGAAGIRAAASGASGGSFQDLSPVGNRVEHYIR